jgi:rod shape-determining protein MreC
VLMYLFIPILVAIFLLLADYKFSYLDSLKKSIAVLVSPVYLVVSDRMCFPGNSL